MELLRFSAQLLSGRPARSVVEVVERLLAVQAQDPRGFRLAIRSRTTGLRASDVEAALADRSVLVTWLNRGTLQLVLAEDYPWLHALTTPQLATSTATRLRQTGVSPEAAERGVNAVVKALSDGPLSRAALRDVVASSDCPVEGQAFIHVLALASHSGDLVRGPVVDGEQQFVLTRDWLEPTRPVSREEALGVLAERYLRGHGPGSDRDLAMWAGITLGDARTGLRHLTLVETDGGVDLRRRRAPALPSPRLLGPFDPVLHGWVSRTWVTGKHTDLVTTNGLFRPFVMVQGHAVGTWSFSGGRVGLALREAVDVDLSAEIADVERFLAS